MNFSKLQLFGAVLLGVYLVGCSTMNESAVTSVSSISSKTTQEKHEECQAIVNDTVAKISSGEYVVSDKDDALSKIETYTKDCENPCLVVAGISLTIYKILHQAQMPVCVSKEQQRGPHNRQQDALQRN